MNKTVKGAVALGAAAFILLGGAGTLAYWSDAEAVDSGTVSTGTLKLVSEGGGSWSEVATADGSVPASIVDIAAYNLVPGDTVKYTESFRVDAVGDNLVAAVKASLAAPDSSVGSVTTADHLSVKTEVTVDGVTTEVTGSDTPAGTITSKYNNALVTVVVTVAFSTAAPDAISQDVLLSLSGLDISLVQKPSA